jgi:hypothetical protein
VAARKVLLFPVAVALGGLIATQWQDIMRYMKIKQMSYGNGHPENVPTRGRASYPQHPNEAGRQGESGRPVGGSTARDRTGVDPPDPIDSSSPNHQTG